MIELLALIAAGSVVGNVILAVWAYRLAVQTRAIAQHVRLLTRRIERTTGQALPQLMADALDTALPEDGAGGEDAFSTLPALGGWDVPSAEDRLIADRHARRG